jgi:DNA-binding transcriptional MerR regulator
MIESMVKTFTTGQVAQASGLPPETLIRWHREGLLRPSERRKKGQRRYAMRDLVAAVAAKVARDDLKFPKNVYEEIAAVVRRADRKELEKCEIVVERTRPGEILGKIFTKTWWLSAGETEQRARLAALPEEDVPSRATLLEILEGKDDQPGLLNSVREHLIRQGLATEQDVAEYLALRPGDAL